MALPPDISAVALTPGKLVKVDTDGKPANATNTDTQVSAAVTSSHAAATVADTASVDMSIAGQQISAAVIFGTDGNTSCVGNDSRLSNTRTPSTHEITSATYHTSNITPGTVIVAAATTGLPKASVHLTENATGVGVGASATNKLTVSQAATGSPIKIKTTDAASDCNISYVNHDLEWSVGNRGTSNNFTVRNTTAEIDRVIVTPLGSVTAQVESDHAAFSICNLGNGNKTWLIKPVILDLVVREADVADVMTFKAGGAIGVGTPTPAAKFAINGGLNVGADADPGDNNLNVEGTVVVKGATDLQKGVKHSGVLVHTGYTGAGLSVTVDTAVYSGISWRPSSDATGTLTVSLSNGAEGRIFKVFNNHADKQILTINDAGYSSYDVGVPGYSSGCASAEFVYDNGAWQMLSLEKSVAERVAYIYNGAGSETITIDTTIYRGIAWRPSVTVTGDLTVHLTHLENKADGQLFTVVNPTDRYAIVSNDGLSYSVGNPGCGGQNSIFIYETDVLYRMS